MAENKLTTEAIQAAFNKLKSEIQSNELLHDYAKSTNEHGGLLPQFIERSLGLKADDEVVVQKFELPPNIATLAKRMREQAAELADSVINGDNDYLLKNPNAVNRSAGAKSILDATEAALQEAAKVQGEKLPATGRLRQ